MDPTLMPVVISVIGYSIILAVGGACVAAAPWSVLLSDEQLVIPTVLIVGCSAHQQCSSPTTLSGLVQQHSHIHCYHYMVLCSLESQCIH